MSKPAEDARMPLLEHLRELRNRVVVAAGAVLLGMLAGTMFVEPVYAFLTAPMRLLLEGGQRYPEVDALYLQLTGPITALLPASLTEARVSGTLAITSSPMEGVYTWLRVALVSGVILASPVVAYQAWAFVAPGLHRSERRVLLPLTLASTLLFALGAGFAYLVLLPVAFPFFLQVIQAEAVLSIDGYLRSLVRMVLAFGLCFQLPIGAWFAARLGFVDARDMVQGFRYAVVVMFVAAAIITPPDVFTQVLLAVPMAILYVLSIGVVALASTKVRPEVATEAT